MSDDEIREGTSLKRLSHQWDSNPRPITYEAIALPTELWWQKNYDRIIPSK